MDTSLYMMTSENIRFVLDQGSRKLSSGEWLHVLKIVLDRMRPVLSIMPLPRIHSLLNGKIGYHRETPRGMTVFPQGIGVNTMFLSAEIGDMHRFGESVPGIPKEEEHILEHANERRILVTVHVDREHNSVNYEYDLWEASYNLEWIEEDQFDPLRYKTTSSCFRRILPGDSDMKAAFGVDRHWPYQILDELSMILDRYSNHLERDLKLCRAQSADLGAILRRIGL